MVRQEKDSDEAGVGELWTIGHWTCAEDQFIDRLQRADVELLVDVRSQPGSRRSPQFDADDMLQWLARADIDYLHLPELGGRRPRQHEVDPTVNAGWRQSSFRNYADYTLGAAYAEGIARLVDLAGEHRLALMCGEPMPWRCHRLLIANTLTAGGWAVWHLIGDATPRRHELGRWGAHPVVDARGTITYPPSPPTAR